MNLLNYRIDTHGLSIAVSTVAVAEGFEHGTGNLRLRRLTKEGNDEISTDTCLPCDAWAHGM